ncbi:MAG: thioredoxin family protein [Sphaerochaetaceae bacterium]|nr:thioredoxin family protein [Sphaerochaetaceae bacterium]
MKINLFGQKKSPEVAKTSEGKNEHTFTVMGSGCAKCNKLEQNVRQALTETGKKANVVHITDISQMLNRGIMSAPALLLDDQVVSTGKLVTVKEIKNIINW